MLDETIYTIHSDKLIGNICIALIADLHGKKSKGLIDSIRRRKPDIIVIAGDFAMVNRRYTDRIRAYKQDTYLESAPTPEWIAEPWTLNVYNPGILGFLEDIAKEAPTYASLGNHEWALGEEDLRRVGQAGIIVLDNAYEKLSLPCGDIAIGGLTSAEVMLIRGFVKYHGYPEYRWRHEHFEHTDTLEQKWMESFRGEQAFRVLLCHHPEYILGDDPAVSLRGMDLALAGHAHGGQIRLGHMGLYAPGQGLFPAYTEGIFESEGAECVVSRGLANTYFFPRVCNSPEVVYIKVKGSTDKQ